jgi:hypothetical protein
MIGFSTGTEEPCGNCLGITCAGASDLLGCDKTCICTSRCNLFCPNGDCLAYCSCFKEEEVGIGDVVAAKFDNSVYIINRADIPPEFSNRDLFHSTLASVNQTWWQVCEDGTYVENPRECGKEQVPSDCFLAA